MSNTLEVLRIFKAFEDLKSSTSLSEADKKAIAGELLVMVPHEIVSPTCAKSSKIVRDVIHAYTSLPKNHSPKDQEAKVSAPNAPARGQGPAKKKQA
jgi:hypothetical protein